LPFVKLYPSAITMLYPSQFIQTASTCEPRVGITIIVSFTKEATEPYKTALARNSARVMPGVLTWDTRLEGDDPATPDISEKVGLCVQPG
jgi:hypothetical protein